MFNENDNSCSVGANNSRTCAATGQTPNQAEVIRNPGSILFVTGNLPFGGIVAADYRGTFDLWQRTGLGDSLGPYSDLTTAARKPRF